MPYGTIKIDTITFTDGGVDKSVPVSGLVLNPTFTGNVTVTGTISGNIIQGGTTVSGLTVTGTTANFASGVFTTQVSGLLITGPTVSATTGTFTSLTGTTTNGTTASFTTGNFTSLTGTTTTGTTANFASGVFTTQVSGLLITGPTVSATTGTFTSLTGTTTTGTTANFASGVFTTQISGVTITGTTVSTTTGNFTSLTGTTATFTSGIIASGTAALPSLAILSDPNTGIYSPGADQLAVATNGVGRLFIDANGNVGLGINPVANTFIGGARGSAIPSLIELAGNGNTVGSTGFVFGQDGSGVGILFQRSNEAMAFSTNGTERLRITAAGLVGIGNSSPSSYNASSDDLVVGDHVGAHGVTICSQNNSSGYIMFADGTTGAQAYAGQITYDHTNNRLTLGTNDGTTGLTVDSSQRVGIGTTDARGVLRLAGSSANAFPNNGGLLWLTDTNAATDYKNWSVSSINGEFGVARGSEAFNTAQNAYKITGAATQGYIGEHIWYTNNSSEKVRIDNSGRLLVGTVTQVGNANGGILQLGSGITFPATPIATTDVNTLDDYEEGTWTPALMAAGYTATYVSNVGKYTKIGNQVFISLYISLSASIAVVPGNGLAIGGLPFSSSTSSNAASTAMTAGDIQNIAYGAGELQLTFYIRTGISDIVGYFTVASAASNVWVAGDIGASAVLIISGSYFV